MRYVVKVSRKGQVTIPKPIRERIGVREGDLLEVSEEGGVVVLRKAGLPEPGDPVGVEEHRRIRGLLDEVRSSWSSFSTRGFS